jgi:hypothetical protein
MLAPIHTVTLGDAHNLVADSLGVPPKYLDTLADRGINRIWVNHHGAIYAYQLCGSDKISLSGELAAAQDYQLPEHLQNLMYPCKVAVDRILDRIFYYGEHNLTRMDQNRLRAIRYADTVLADPALPRFIRLNLAMTPQCDINTLCDMLGLSDFTSWILRQFKLSCVQYIWMDRHGHPYAYHRLGQIGVCLMGSLDQALEWSPESRSSTSESQINAILDRIIEHGISTITSADLRMLRAY